jgi:hypothetical protein
VLRTFSIQHAFVRSADGETFTNIDYPGALATIPGGINESGEIVGGYADTPESGTFFVPHGWVFTTFDSACGTTRSFAHSTNEPFAVVGSYTDVVDLGGEKVVGSHGF